MQPSALGRESVSRARITWLLVAAVLLLSQSWASQSLAQATSSLDVAGFPPAVLVAPSATSARPVVVLLHGRGDSPDWICEAFAPLVAGRAWLVCPRGEPYGDGFTYGDRATVAREVRAVLAALGGAHRGRVDASSPLLAGFSLGAMHAAFLSRASPRIFRRAFIIDTHHTWTPAEFARFRGAGGVGAMFVCTRSYVADCARVDAASTLVVPSREHGYDASFVQLLRPSFDALIASDARWRL